MENKGNQTYKTKGLEFYITNALNKNHAVRSFIQYRIGVTENDIELFEGKIPDKANVMSAIELSTRELALEWWNDLPEFNHKGLSKTFLYSKYKEELNLTCLTDREIEEIWRKENKIDVDLEIWYNAHKPNQKQFKQFNTELFEAYIDKFSEEDQIRAFDVLAKRMLRNGFSKDQMRQSINFLTI